MLIEAIQNDEGALITAILDESGINLNKPLPDSTNSPLMFAIEMGKHYAVSSLLEAKAFPDWSNVDGETAFHVAAKYCRPACLKLLFSKSTGINKAIDWRGTTAKESARGATILTPSSCRTKTLSTARRTTSEQCGKMGVTSTPVGELPSTRLRDAFGRAPLHQIANGVGSKVDEAVECLNILLLAKADIEAKTSDNATALHLLCSRGPFVATIPCIEALILWKCELSPIDNLGRSPYHYALENKDCDIGIITLLSAHQAPADIQDVGGVTPLNLACKSGRIDCVDCLLSAKVPVSIEDKSGRTPLHWAARSRGSNCIHALLTEGASLGKRNKDGLTALHEACYGFDVADKIMALLAAGESSNAQDNQGRTVLHHAMISSSSNVHVVVILLDHPRETINAKRMTISKAIRDAKTYSIRPEDLDLIVEFAVSLGCDPRLEDSHGVLAHQLKIDLCTESIPPYTDDLRRRKRSKIRDALT